MQCRLLFDECIPFALIQGLRRQSPASYIAQVGEPGEPSKGSGDVQLLLFCEAHKRMFVSGDRSTLPRHVAAHRANGRNTYGVAIISRGYRYAEVIEDLTLVVECSSAEEWINEELYVPSLTRA